MDSDNQSSMLRNMLTAFAAFAGLAGWAGAAGAGLLSATGPVIAIIADDLFVGEAEGHLDGSGTFQFQRLTILRGYGTGSVSRRSMSFTYGLSSVESEPYLTLPRGKALRLNGKDLLLLDATRSIPANLPMAAPEGGDPRPRLY